jgi:hypothetical protein
MTFDIPNKDGLWVFTSPSTWQTWVKPTQYNNFIIYVCGGGGGGASGASGVAGTARGGGGGGGGGCLTILNSPSYLLPETLYLNIGVGGAGSITNIGSGTLGGTTYLNYFPNTNTANIILSSAGGGGGTISVGGSGGAISINQSIFSISGTNASAGTVGGTGNPATFGANFIVTTSCIYGGTGGGGCGTDNVSYQGGSILASNIHSQLDGGALSGGNGNTGYFIKKPFTALGGTGGGANGTGTPGSGGNGVMGSGGGGGGGGTSVSRGGRGGDGFVIIIGY